MSLNLDSKGDNFIFQLPYDFVPAETESKYKAILDIEHAYYESIADFLNSTIVGISFPGLTLPTVQQNIRYGKEIRHRGAISPYDVIGREFRITFRSVNAHLNYFILQDLILNHYISTQNSFINPFIIFILDQNHQPRFTYELREIVLTGMSEIQFAYNDTDLNRTEFTVSFVCNYVDPNFVDPNQIPDLTKRPL